MSGENIYSQSSPESGYSGQSGMSPNFIPRPVIQQQLLWNSNPGTLDFHESQIPITITYPSDVYPSSIAAPRNISMNTIHESSPRPYLQIIEQPQDDPFHYRYLKEMRGQHGTLAGQNSTDQDKTSPTIKLHNFVRPALVKIRCSFYQFDPVQKKMWPHPHGMVIHPRFFEACPHYDIVVSNNNDFTAKFKQMAIINTKKDDIPEKLEEKYRIAKEIEVNRPLTVNELDGIKQNAKTQLELLKVNLHQVTLGFQAFADYGNGWAKIGDPLYSNPVRNKLAVQHNKLSIAKMSKTSSPASGKQEVMMFTEKVSKDDIEVIFFENFHDGSRVIIGKGQVMMVYRQFGIVFETPPYTNQFIVEPANVMVELHRPSDQRSSKPFSFVYEPNAKIPRSQLGGMYELQFAASSANGSFQSMFQQPSNTQQTTLPSYSNTFSSNINFAALSLSPSDLGERWDSYQEFQTDFEMRPPPLQNDGPGDDKTIRRVDGPILEKMKILVKFFQHIFDHQRLQEMMTELVKAEVEIDGNVILDCIQHGTIDEIKDLVQILVKFKMTDLLQTVNELDQNCLHLLILAGHQRLLKAFLKFNVDVNQPDAFGQTPLHVAAQVKSVDSVRELLALCDNIKLDAINDEGFSPLHVAIKESNFSIISLLIQAGADLKLKEPKTGNNLLHMAVAADNVEMSVIQFLIRSDKDLLHLENNSKMNALQLADDLKLPGNLIQCLESCYGGSSNGASEGSEREYESEIDSVSERDEYEISSASESDVEYPNPLFDEFCLNELCQIFDKDEKWKQLLRFLDLDEKIKEWEEVSCPSKQLFKYLERINKTDNDISTILNMMDQPEAVQVIDEMLARKFDQ